ncbi:MAG: PAS domain S-box protein [Pseudomonadota bacterium]
MNAGVGSSHDCAVFMVDLDGKISSWNAEAARFNGMQSETVLGRDFSSLFAAEAIVGDQLRCDLATVAREGGYVGEGWRLGHDGVRFWANIVMTTMRDAEGGLNGYCAVIRDLGENSLGSEQFRLAIEATPTGMIVVDQSGRIALVNAQIESLFGYARAELIGQAVELLVPVRFRSAHPSFRSGFFGAPHARMMGAGRDLYGLHKDGREVPIEIGLNPLETSEGVFVLSSIVDITERKRASEQFRLAIEASPTGMIMVDRHGCIVLVNAHVEALFGYAREELIGRVVEMLVPQQFRQHHPGFRQDFFKAPHSRPMGAGRDLRGLHKSGEEIPIEISLNPVETADGIFVLCSVVNITERIRVQHQRETLLQEIHHRIKNNLQVVSSLISIQLNRTDDATSRDSLSGCAARVQAIALIHAMLYQTHDYLHISFSEYIHRLAGNVFSAADGGASGGRISLELTVDKVELHVDKAVPCGLILNELITNALKHGFPDVRHGVVRVELHIAGHDRLCLIVKDNGVGIPTNLNPLEVKSVGMQLVRELAVQLRATLEIERNDWTAFKLEFSSEV